LLPATELKAPFDWAIGARLLERLRKDDHAVEEASAKQKS
jgi:hypothetical protein